MLKMTNRVAEALLAYACERDLEDLYHKTMTYLGNGYATEQMPHVLAVFLSQIPTGQNARAVLKRFVELAREHMNLLECEVVSAIPLDAEQRELLEQKLIEILHKRLNITCTVDSTLLGGLRILVDNTVFDDTIKRKLIDMKSSIYKGVYLNLWN